MLSHHERVVNPGNPVRRATTVTSRTLLRGTARVLRGRVTRGTGFHGLSSGSALPIIRRANVVVPHKGLEARSSDRARALNGTPARPSLTQSPGSTTGDGGMVKNSTRSPRCPRPDAAHANSSRHVETRRVLARSRRRIDEPPSRRRHAIVMPDQAPSVSSAADRGSTRSPAARRQRRCRRRRRCRGARPSP